MQLSKFKSGIKKWHWSNFENFINCSWWFRIKIIKDENNFWYELLLTNTQVSKLRKAFANNFLDNIKLSKTQLHKIGQSGGFLGRLLGLLLNTGLPLIGNVLKTLAKSVLIPLGLTTAGSATDTAVHKKIFGSGNTALLISNKEMNYIVKIIKSL